MTTENSTINSIKKRSYYQLKDVPMELRTEKACIASLSIEFSQNIDDVPTEIRTERFLKERIKSEKKSLTILDEFYNGPKKALLKYIPENLKSLKVCGKAIAIEASNMTFVPDKIKTNKFIEDMLSVNGEVLQFLPNELKTKAICQRAFENNIEALNYIPYEFITLSYCERYIAEGFSIGAIPKKMLTPELLALGVRSKRHRVDRSFFNAIPKKLKNSNLMFELIRLDAHYLYRFHASFEELGMINNKSLLKIVSINFRCLKEIPAKLLTRELCLAALEAQVNESKSTELISHSIEILKYFPKSFIDNIVAEKAVRLNPQNLKYVPQKYKTETLIRAAAECTRNLSEIIEYFPLKMITEEICLAIIKDPQGEFWKIPDKAKTENVCRTAVKENVNYINSIPENIFFPELLMHCNKSRFPSPKVFAQLMDTWVENETASHDDFAVLLNNAPEKIKKTSTWKKWSLVYHS